MDYKQIVSNYTKQSIAHSKSLLLVHDYFQTERRKSGYELEQIQHIIDDVWNSGKSQLRLYILQNFIYNVFERVVSELEQSIAVAIQIPNSNWQNIVKEYNDRFNQILTEEATNWFNSGISINKIEYDPDSNSIKAKVDTIGDKTEGTIFRYDIECYSPGDYIYYLHSSLDKLRTYTEQIKFPSKEDYISTFENEIESCKTWPEASANIINKIIFKS